jgi:hypothetical protein
MPQPAVASTAIKNRVFGAATGHAVEPSFSRAELADRAPRSQSPWRTQ